MPQPEKPDVAKEKTMSDKNGYLIASTEIGKGVAAAFADGATIDEVFAALKVQSEVMNVRLAQAFLHEQEKGNEGVIDNAN
jgi:hypothetical protein